MVKLVKALICATALLCAADAGAKVKTTENEVLGRYYTHATATPVAPQSDGFIRRWTILEPIAIPISSNSNLTDDFLSQAVATPYFKDQFSLIPYDGLTTAIGKEKHIWHALDSKDFYLNLLRFAEGYGKEYFQQLYWVVTVIECNEDIEDVRLSAGVNSGAVWFVNGEEVLKLTNDRDLVTDDCMSRRLTLHKGRNVLRGAVFNGPGLADFCLRFVDESGKPVTAFTVSCSMSKK